MTRDGLPRAYLRMSPDLDQHPDPLAMVRAMCAAARQPYRGRFRDPRVLERAVGKRQYREMVQRGDVLPEAPGIYLVGWDEWQEGDLTVGERMRRLRERRKRRGDGNVTARTSPDRSVVTTDALDIDVDTSSQATDDRDSSPPPAKLGQRKNGTNPRALGTNPRATGTSPRQQKAAEKRGGLDSLATILEKSNRAAEREREANRQEALELHARYKRGELSPSEYERLRADIGKQPDDLTRAGA